MRAYLMVGHSTGQKVVQMVVSTGIEKADCSVVLRAVHSVVVTADLKAVKKAV